MRGYTILGWIVWQLVKRVVLVKKVADNRVKLGAGGVVALVLIGGLLAAKAGSGQND